jgi:hypothetical protein
MKVMCIQEDWTCQNKEAQKAPRPVFGDIDVVVATDGSGDDLYYKLERFAGWFYWARNFAPLSNIEEEQLEYSKMQIS